RGELRVLCRRLRPAERAHFPSHAPSMLVSGSDWRNGVRNRHLRCKIPSSSRTPPWPPRASLRSRAAVCESSWCQKASVHNHGEPTGNELLLKIRPTTMPLTSASKSSSFHLPKERLAADARFRINACWNPPSASAQEKTVTVFDRLADSNNVDWQSDINCL